MRSLILKTATRLLLPLMLLFSIFLLIRGHNEPGGGFVAGLVAASAFALYAIAFGIDRAEDALHISTINMIGGGLLLAALSAAFPLLLGDPFFTILWLPFELPVVGKTGTAFTFDTGVYLVVIGVTLTIIFAMAETEEE